MTLLIVAAHNDESHRGSAKRNLAGGVIGLSDTEYIDQDYLPVVVEKYTNHNGDIDNYMTTSIINGASATEDAGNHELDLKTNIAGASKITYQSKDQCKITDRVVYNVKLNNVQFNSDIGNKRIVFGLMSAFNGAVTDLANIQSEFVVDAWSLNTQNNGGVTTTTHVNFSISDDDLFTIVVCTDKVEFYQNDLLLGKHTTNIPTGDMEFGVGLAVNIASDVLRLDVDYINFESIMKV